MRSERSACAHNCRSVFAAGPAFGQSVRVPGSNVRRGERPISFRVWFWFYAILTASLVVAAVLAMTIGQLAYMAMFVFFALLGFWLTWWARKQHQARRNEAA